MASVQDGVTGLPGFQVFARNDRFFDPNDLTVSSVAYVEAVIAGDVIRLSRFDNFKNSLGASLMVSTSHDMRTLNC